ncbi:hypothetical protein DL93DRAFT_956661 [Clavulina sp. PMI_390]|nr:hypothetical protein DL93DRAFT_956661 [Clavulina sp. PMI_390]
MEELLTSLGQGPQNGEDPKELAAMREAWEKMLIAGMDGADPGSAFGGLPPGQPSAPAAAPSTSAPSSTSAPVPGPSKPTPAQAKNEAFQDSIRQAMDKLKESEETLKADAASGSDPLAKILADLNLDNLDLGADGEDPGMQAMLENMMASLMTKEMLYDPLKELETKYPDFLKENASKLSAEDKDRYEKQSAKVKEITTVFEQPDYSDDNSAFSMKILGLMNEMQSMGSPPTEIMGEMPPGMVSSLFLQ